MERVKVVARCDTDSAMRHFAYAFMAQDPDGDYVTYADVQAQIARLTEEAEGSAVLLVEAQAEIARLTELFDLSQKTVKAVLARAEKAEAERDAALAQVTEQRMDVVAMAEMAASLIEDMSKKPGTTWGQVKAAVRALGDLGDRSALSRRDAQLRAEGRKDGMLEAAGMLRYGYGPMRDRVEAILAAAEKEAGNG